VTVGSATVGVTVLLIDERIGEDDDCSFVVNSCDTTESVNVFVTLAFNEITLDLSFE